MKTILLILLFVMVDSQFMFPGEQPPPPPWMNGPNPFRRHPWRRRRPCNFFDSIDEMANFPIFNRDRCSPRGPPPNWNPNMPPPPSNQWNQQQQWPGSQNQNLPSNAINQVPNTTPRSPIQTTTTIRRLPPSWNRPTNVQVLNTTPSAPIQTTTTIRRLPPPGNRPSNGQDLLNIVQSGPTIQQFQTTRPPVIITTQRPITSTLKAVFGPNGKIDPNSDFFIPLPPK